MVRLVSFKAYFLFFSLTNARWALQKPHMTKEYTIISPAGPLATQTLVTLYSYSRTPPLWKIEVLRPPSTCQLSPKPPKIHGCLPFFNTEFWSVPKKSVSRQVLTILTGWEAYSQSLLRVSLAHRDPQTSFYSVHIIDVNRIISRPRTCKSRMKCKGRRWQHYFSRKTPKRGT